MWSMGGVVVMRAVMGTIQAPPSLVAQVSPNHFQLLTANTAVSVNLNETETIELWQWLLLILALVVIGESVLANLHLAPRPMALD